MRRKTECSPVRDASCASHFGQQDAACRIVTHLKHKQLDPYMIHEPNGHTINSETMGRYGKRFTPEILLKEVVAKIDYGIDLDDQKWQPENVD